MTATNPLAPGSHRMIVDGLVQRYHVVGQGPLCIAHSGGPGIDWGYMRMPEAEAQLTMLYVEPIGTGESGRLASHPQGYTVTRYSEQLLALVDALGLDRVFVLGHSHGGFVAQQFAVDHRERVSGIALYSTAAYTGGEFMADAQKGVERFVSRYEGSVEAEAALRAWRSPRNTDASYTEAMRGLLPVYFVDHHRLGARYTQLHDAIRATVVMGDNLPFDTRADLPSLDVPALVLVGMHDFICGPRHADLLSDVLPDVRIVRFADSGHFVHIEQPQAFADALVSFVLPDTALSATRPRVVG